MTFKLEVNAGELLEPGSDGYDEARTLWNVAIDKRPAVIALPRTASEVAAAVGLARERDLPIAVRGGGHSVAGYSVIDAGMMINLSLLDQVTVDPDSWLASAGGGTLLGGLDRATWGYGRAVPSGHVSHTGVGGLTLGGGIGWLMRRYGLTIDQITSMEMVTADGEIVTASEHENSDLFFGLRGAGANFGITTKFEFKTVDLKTSGFLSGAMMFPWSKARDALKLSRDLMEDAPDELTIFEALFTAPHRPPFSPEQFGQQMVTVGAAYVGSTDDGNRLLEPLRRLGPVLDLVCEQPYTTLQSMNDVTAPWGLRQYSRAHWQNEMPDEAIDALLDSWERVPSTLARIVSARMGGAVGRVPDRDMAFCNRTANRLIWLSNMWQDPAEDDEQRQWLVEAYDAMETWSTGSGYINVASDEAPDRIETTYGTNWRRLVDLKGKYDPDNVFSRNQNIPPGHGVSAVRE